MLWAQVVLLILLGLLLMIEFLGCFAKGKTVSQIQNNIISMVCTILVGGLIFFAGGFDLIF